VRVALFITCLVDGITPDVGRATVTLLERLGVEVDVPLQQSCCGQIHVNTGYPRQALALVENHVSTFAGYDAVVVPSGSCTGAIRHQHAELARSAGDEHLATKSESLAAKTYELSEFLIDVLGAEDVGAYYPHRVTYHPTCHSLRLLRVGDRPLRLLRHVGGIELIELPDADQCCGFGGTFSIKNSAVSAAMMDDKVTAIRTTEADVCAASDTSCLLHIGGGLSRQAAPARTAHLAQILASTKDAQW
jgi:L-lactate dehydrogenase complex protein LldE